jgi:hypothetical protein
MLAIHKIEYMQAYSMLQMTIKNQILKINKLSYGEDKPSSYKGYIIYYYENMYATKIRANILVVTIITITVLTLLTSTPSGAYVSVANAGSWTESHKHHHNHHHGTSLKCIPTVIHFTDQSVTSIAYRCNISSTHTATIHIPSSVGIR